MSRFPLGRKAVLLISTDGAAYTKVDQTSDVTLNLTTKEDDDTIRANGGYEAIAKTLNMVGVEFTMKARGNEPQFKRIQESHLPDGPPLRVKTLSEDEAQPNAHGPWAWMTVTQLNRTENLGEVQKYSVSLKVVNPPAGKEAEIPEWIGPAEAA